MDDFEKFHLRKAKRRPLGDVSSLVNKPNLHRKDQFKPLPTRHNRNIDRDRPSHASEKRLKSTLKMPLSQILLLAKPILTQSSSNEKSAFSTKSLLFDVPASKRPTFEPRYRHITEHVIKPMSDTNELTSLSNASVRAFTEWYKLRNYTFVAKEGTQYTTLKPENTIKPKSLIVEAQQKPQSFALFTVVEACRRGPYLLAVLLSCTRAHEFAQSGIFDVLLMNPDSRIDARQHDTVLLSEQGKFATKIAGVDIPVYAAWKIEKAASSSKND